MRMLDNGRNSIRHGRAAALTGAAPSVCVDIKIIRPADNVREDLIW